MGGGTFWGLGALLTGCKSFDDLIQLASTGNHKNVSTQQGDTITLLNSVIVTCHQCYHIS